MCSIGTCREEACTEHLAVVEDKKVVWLQKRGEITHITIFEERLGGSIYYQHLGLIFWFDGVLRDAAMGEMVVK